jgi:hypothetical protein
MKQYIIPFLVYILIMPIVGLLTDNKLLGYALRIFLTVVLLYYYRNKYDVKIRFDFLALIVGVLVFVSWIFLDFSQQVNQITTFGIIIRLLGSILIAPIIEELFTRDFLIRFLVNPYWKKVKVGTYTFPSFIITVLFFGFSHGRWVAGLVAGVLFNLLLYKKKDVGKCIFAHMIANFLLSVYIIITGSWYFW